MNKRILVGSALALLLAAGVIGFTMAMAHPGPNQRDVEPHVNQVPSQSQDVPALTEDQVAKMNDIISKNTTLSTLSQGNYTVEDYGPWVAGDKTFIGAIAEISLSAPTTYQGKLSVVAFAPSDDGAKEYQKISGTTSASGIKSLYILLDLKEEEVVGIEIATADSHTFSSNE